MCELMKKKLDELQGEAKSESIYYIFVWKHVVDKCELQIAVGDVNIFTRGVQYWLDKENPARWHRPATITFFSRPTSTLVLPIPNQANLIRSQTMPRLTPLPDRDPDCPEAYQRACEWLDECCNNNLHPQCTRPPTKLPKRVVDLSRLQTEARVSVHFTNDETKLQPYAAISYSWGETDCLAILASGQPSTARSLNPADYIVKLTTVVSEPGKELIRNDVAEYRADDIPLSAFPRTQRDALRIANTLGFRYIWVDSLCILQGDLADWADQGSAMTQTYGNTSLVISATSTENAVQGTLRSVEGHELSIGTWQCRDASNPEYLEILVGDPKGVLDLEQKFLSTRGWVFQERLVSTATLHYTDEGIVWECAQKTTLRHHQAVSRHPWKANWRRLMALASSGSSSVESITTSLGKTPNAIWYEWISAYSQRDLYDVNDRLPAVAGLAKTFEGIFGHDYVAGLWWKEHFVEGLLWRRSKRVKTLVRFSHVAPSWSWASVYGGLEFRGAGLKDSPIKGPVLEVLEHHVVEEDPESYDPASGPVMFGPTYGPTYGRVRAGGTIVVRGMLQRVTLDLQSRPTVRTRDYQECGVAEGFVNGENVLCMLDELERFEERLYPCWCLYIGAYNKDGREANAFLLLDRLDESTNTFSRIGMAETDAWFDRMKPTPNSGVFKNAELTKLVIQ